MSTDIEQEQPATKYADIFSRLAAPFEPREVKVLNKGGRSLQYITARTAMNRLDNVLGPENWTDSYTPWGDHCLICTLVITLPDGMQIAKTDGGGRADMQAADDNDKSAFSDAFKRACVKFGIGRYLYRDGAADFGSVDTAEPTERCEPLPNPPRSGKALFGACRELETHYGIALIKDLNDWGKAKGQRAKIVDWPEDFVQSAWLFISAVVARHARTNGQPTDTAAHSSPNGTPPPSINEQRRELYALCARVVNLLNQQPADVTPDKEQVKEEVNRVAAMVMPGRRIESLSELTVPNDLALFVEKARERLKEVQEAETPF